MRRSVAVDRLGPKLLLVWAGVALGVAFVATPAKFLASSLSLPVALDVGRHTFTVYDRLELAMLAGLLGLGIWSRDWRRWYAILLLPAAVVLAEALWLLPALDLRVAAILGGRPADKNSSLHAIYIAAEALKILALAAAGLHQPATRDTGFGARTANNPLR
jgi:hypothetical protein